MSELVKWTLIVFISPFILYVVVRIVSSAAFKSFFEQKREFENKEVKDGRKGT